MDMNVKQFRSIAEKQVIVRGMIQNPGMNPEARKGAGTQVLVQAYIISSRLFSGDCELVGLVSYCTDLDQSDPLVPGLLSEVPILYTSLSRKVDGNIHGWLNYWDAYRGPWRKPTQCIIARELQASPVQKFEEYQGIPLCVLLNLARVLEFLRGKIYNRGEVALASTSNAELVLAQDLYVRITGFLSEQQRKISSAVNELSGLLA